jgi:hypothetical protein
MRSCARPSPEPPTPARGTVVFFRILLIAFGAGVTFFVVRFLQTGQRGYLNWAGRLLGLGLASGLLFFAVLLVARLA